MTSLERFQAVLSHQTPDHVCVDFGATAVTGVAASTVSRLRQALLEDDDYRVKVVEPYQMLGEIDELLQDAVGIDVLGVTASKTMFGFANENWKPFALFDGTEVLVPEGFRLTEDGQGGWYIHPQGNTTAPPSGHMPAGGFYFDAICRQDPIEEDKLDPRDNLQEFALLEEEEIAHFLSQAKKAAQRQKGAILSVPGTGFGDIALVPAMWELQPKGIREVEEWYVSTVARKDYVTEVFEGQCEIALANLARLAEALGDLVQVAFTTGTDFGMQQGPFISPATYRELYQPFHKEINDFIHKHTHWKVFIHSCGSVRDLIPDFIESGFDILNPVQCSAAGMDPTELKREFGKDLVFWGGGVDTQRTLPFGTPDEVYREVMERIDILGEGGGFVFNTIHNVQSDIPLENVLAMVNALKDSRS